MLKPDFSPAKEVWKWAAGFEKAKKNGQPEFWLPTSSSKGVLAVPKT